MKSKDKIKFNKTGLIKPMRAAHGLAKSISEIYKYLGRPLSLYCCGEEYSFEDGEPVVALSFQVVDLNGSGRLIELRIEKNGFQVKRYALENDQARLILISYFARSESGESVKFIREELGI